MKELVFPGQFNDVELQVIHDPGYINTYLELVCESERIEERKMYHYAKQRFDGVISKQVLKELVDNKFKVLTNIRVPSKQTKIQKLRNAINKGKSRIANQEESLRNLMGEPFHLITEPGGKC